MHYDVIVAGGGPVGTCTAVKLGRAGLKVRLLEARDELGSERRATTFHPPSLEMLDELGLAEPLIAEGIRCDSYQYRDLEHGRIARLDYAVLDGLTPYPYRLQVEQSRLTVAANQALEGLDNVEVSSGTPLVGASQDTTGVRVTYRDEEGIATITADHLIAADGSKSTVREQLEIPFHGKKYPERYLVVSTSRAVDEDIPDIDHVNYITGPDQWNVILHNPAGWRLLFPITDLESDHAVLASEERVLALSETLVPGFTSDDVDHVTLYEIQRKVADHFRDGRIFLVGDAAHVNNPLGGMGMNSGLHDGLLLASVLTDTYEDGEALSDALDAWAAVRRNVALEFVGAQTDRNWEQLQNAAKRAETHEHWRELEADEELRRTFLLKASMMASVQS